MLSNEEAPLEVSGRKPMMHVHMTINYYVSEILLADLPIIPVVYHLTQAAPGVQYLLLTQVMG